jgi:hypothetical protein
VHKFPPSRVQAVTQVSRLAAVFPFGAKFNIWRCLFMSEKELQHLYNLLEKVKDEKEKAALRHAIFIIEQYNHVY